MVVLSKPIRSSVPMPSKIEAMENYMQQLRKDGDSIGAKITVVASGMPPGLGEPIFDRLDADIAHALMSINAVKGVEIGAGFDCIAQRGSEHRDEITPQGFTSNNAGGVLGGISSGQDIVAHIALKPTSSMLIAGPQHRYRRQSRRSYHHRSPRSVCRHSRHADCRSDARDCAARSSVCASARKMPMCEVSTPSFRVP